MFSGACNKAIAILTLYCFVFCGSANLAQSSSNSPASGANSNTQVKAKARLAGTINAWIQQVKSEKYCYSSQCTDALEQVQSEANVIDLSRSADPQKDIRSIHNLVIAIDVWADKYAVDVIPLLTESDMAAFQSGRTRIHQARVSFDDLDPEGMALGGPSLHNGLQRDKESVGSNRYTAIEASHKFNISGSKPARLLRVQQCSAPGGCNNPGAAALCEAAADAGLVACIVMCPTTGPLVVVCPAACATAYSLAVASCIKSNC
jgi:hypothetical protein